MLDIRNIMSSNCDYTTIGFKNSDIILKQDETWPIDDNSVGLIISEDTLTNFSDQIKVMNEAWRVLTHGGFFLIDIPSTDGKGAFNPAAKSFWNDRTVRYFVDGSLRQFIEPECNCRFLSIKVENIDKFGLPYVRAHLIAIKNDYRFMGHYTL